MSEIIECDDCGQRYQLPQNYSKPSLECRHCGFVIRTRSRSANSASQKQQNTRKPSRPKLREARRPESHRSDRHRSESRNARPRHAAVTDGGLKPWQIAAMSSAVVALGFGLISWMMSSGGEKDGVSKPPSDAVASNDSDQSASEANESPDNNARSNAPPARVAPVNPGNSNNMNSVNNAANSRSGIPTFPNNHPMIADPDPASKPKQTMAELDNVSGNDTGSSTAAMPAQETESLPSTATQNGMAVCHVTTAPSDSG